jgi:hypothetical protein
MTSFTNMDKLHQDRKKDIMSLTEMDKLGIRLDSPVVNVDTSLFPTTSTKFLARLCFVKNINWIIGLTTIIVFMPCVFAMCSLFSSCFLFCLYSLIGCSTFLTFLTLKLCITEFMACHRFLNQL